MDWELVAIWLIVAATLVWFVRDERRLRFARLAEQAREYAMASAWRHREPAMSTPVAPRPPRDLTEVQRQFIEEMRRQRR